MGKLNYTIKQLFLGNAKLFDKDRTVITKHINKILKERKLDNIVCANFAHTAADGKTYQVEYYNLDMIISAVGYRVNSKRGIAFRKWATNLLKECLIKGYSINLHCFYERLHSKIIL
nr:RhuM family protein [Rickettsia conorii]